MIKRILSPLLPLFLLFSSIISAEVLQYENQVIRKVEVIVHLPTGDTYDSSSVASRLITKTNGIFSQCSFDEDLKLLAKDYDRIEPSIESDENQVSIAIEVWPKPIVRSIEWVGAEKVNPRRLKRELGIELGSVYEKKAFNTAFHKIKAYYIRKGFFEAELDYNAILNTETNQVDITIVVNEGRSGKIAEVVFNNFLDDERDDILHQMITKKYNIFLSWLDQSGVYNEEIIRHDQLVITNYLQNEGYADAEVTIEIVEACKEDRIQVVITANRGERYYFNKLSFEGNCVLSSEEINRLFTVRPGDPYSLEDLRETVEALNNAYGKIGYIDAVVDFEPDLVEGQTLYDINFKINEGQEFRVGMIRVFGNTVTQTPVILHETILVPGEVFNTLKLKATERRLQNMDYFKNVNVYVVKGADSQGLGGNYRDVYIEVEEKGTGQMSASLGYSSVEEIFAGFQLAENNFNYKGLCELHTKGPMALRGGGEYASFNANIGQKSTSYTISWTKPFFMDTKWAVGVDLSRSTTRYISDYYDLSTSLMKIRGSHKLNEYVRFGVHYRLQNGVTHLHDMRHEEHEHPHGAHELIRESHIHGLISAIGTSLNYDSTNNPVKPTKGFRSKLAIEFAGVGGDHSFIGLNYLNTYYFPVGSRIVIKYRGDLRFLQPLFGTHYASMPLDERLFLGGDYEVRGYRPYRIGPQYGHSHIPRGGLSMQLYSVELSRRLWCDWDVFAFMDAGSLSKDTFEFGGIRASIGYGLRFKLPVASIPPMTIGMGYPLNAKNNSEVKRFFIQFGANF